MRNIFAHFQIKKAVLGTLEKRKNQQLPGAHQL